MFIDVLKDCGIFLLGLLGGAIAVFGSMYAATAHSPFWLFLTIQLGICLEVLGGKFFVEFK